MILNVFSLHFERQDTRECYSRGTRLLDTRNLASASKNIMRIIGRFVGVERVFWQIDGNLQD